MNLTQFLKQAAEEGHTDSEGNFTLSKEKALEKLAAFTLPDESWWVLKVIQSAVIMGAQSIKVGIGRDATTLNVEVARPFELDDIEKAFFDPEYRGQRGLRQLILGLWSVGLEMRRAFSITAGLEGSSLVWDGLQFRRTRGKSVAFEISVTPIGIGSVAAPWVGRALLKSERNAALLKTLSERAFPCPVPLRVDGRRMDCLTRMPDTGDHPNTILYSLLLLKDGEPAFPIPRSSQEHHLARSWRGNGLVSPTPNSSTSTHLAALLVGFFEKGSRRRQYARRPSIVAWVEDGVLLQQETLTTALTAGCRMTLFITAKGLPKDLTGFQLLRNKNKSQRLLTALQEVLPALNENGIIKPVIEDLYDSGLWLGAGVVIASTILAKVTLPLGILAFMGGGMKIASSAHSTEVETDRLLLEHYRLTQTIEQKQQQLKAREYSPTVQADTDD